MLVRDRVINIRELPPTEAYVYDLKAKNSHTFLANNILVHNTDSLYVAMPKESGLEFTQFVNEWFRNHLIKEHQVPENRIQVELEYENYFERIFFVRKKRYAGLMTMYKGKDASFTEIKGLEVMRSDGIGHTREMQKTVIEMLIRENAPPMKLLDFFCQEREKVLNGTLECDELTITKGLSKRPEEYKGKLVHVELARNLRDRGSTEYYVGMKVPFIVTGSKPKLEAVLAEDYTGGYDTSYYWDRLIFPASYRIVSACYPQIAWDLLFTKPLSAGQKESWTTIEEPDDDEKGDVHGGFNGNDAGTARFPVALAEASVWSESGADVD